MKIKKLEYYDLHLKRDTLTMNKVFGNLRKICFEIYKRDQAKCLSVPELARQTALVELELLTDTDVLLMVKKGIRGGICHSINRNAKVNNKYMKNCNKNKESSYLKYWDVNNPYGWAMSQF